MTRDGTVGSSGASFPSEREGCAGEEMVDPKSFFFFLSKMIKKLVKTNKKKNLLRAEVDGNCLHEGGKEEEIAYSTQE